MQLKLHLLKYLITVLAVWQWKHWLHCHWTLSQVLMRTICLQFSHCLYFNSVITISHSGDLTFNFNSDSASQHQEFLTSIMLVICICSALKQERNSCEIYTTNHNFKLKVWLNMSFYCYCLVCSSLIRVCSLNGYNTAMHSNRNCCWVEVLTAVIVRRANFCIMKPCSQ